MADVNFQERLFFALVIHYCGFLCLVNLNDRWVSLHVIHLDLFAKGKTEVLNLLWIKNSILDDLRVKVGRKIVDMGSHRVAKLCYTKQPD